MTEGGRESVPAWASILRQFARVSGHELRNALNALVVNLEVVRARSGALDAKSQDFVAQAVEQAEESVRLAEGSIALLNIVTGAIGAGGTLKVQNAGERGASVSADESESARVSQALAPLARRAGLAADAAGAGVILSIPQDSPESSKNE